VWGPERGATGPAELVVVEVEMDDPIDGGMTHAGILEERFELTFAGGGEDGSPQLYTLRIGTSLHAHGGGHADGAAAPAPADLNAAFLDALHALTEHLAHHTGLALLEVSRLRNIHESVELPSAVRRTSAAYDPAPVHPEPRTGSVHALHSRSARPRRHLRLVQSGGVAAALAMDDCASQTVCASAVDVETRMPIEIAPPSAAQPLPEQEELLDGTWGARCSSSGAGQVPHLLQYAHEALNSRRPWTAINRRRVQQELMAQYHAALHVLNDADDWDTTADG
jgi:hypothetical protein